MSQVPLIRTPAQAESFRPALESAQQRWRPSRDTRLVAACVAAYVASAGIAGVALKRPALVGFDVYVWPFVLALALVPIGVVLYRRLTTIRSESPGLLRAYAVAWKTARKDLLANERLLDFVAIGGLTMLLMTTLSGWKQMLPFIHPLSWDARLAAADRLVHFGRDPWRLLDLALHPAWIVRSLDAVYYVLWFQLMWAVFVWQAWQPRTATRAQFLVAFALSWIVLGTVAALAFSSGGPVYYDKLVLGADPFAAQRHYLATLDAVHPLVGIHVEQWLWNVYAARSPAGGAGLSAMPSLHVGMAELCAVVARRSASRALGYATTLFSLMILIGSVYLLPHYAVDGYAAILGVHAIWWISGGLVRTA